MKKKYITVDDIKYQLANLRQLTFIMIMISVKIAQLVCPLL